MKTHIQRILAFALLTLVVSLPVVHAQQQNRTDYQIVQDFRNQYSNLKSQVQSASTVDDINGVISKINAFENEYESHKDLINSAVYPDTYDGLLGQLKSSSQSKLANLQTIQEQSQQLANLNQQVAQYSRQLQMLSSEADSIRKVMVRSQTSERNLRALVRRYRDNMQQRDQLIQSMIDTLYVASNKIGATESASGKTMNVDVLGTIRNLITQNMNFIDNNPTMSTEDLLHLYAVQTEFSDMWSQLGDKIAAIYSGNQKAMDVVKNIDQSNQQWHSKISDNTFKSVAATFKEQGFDLPEFNDGASLYSALRTYLDNAVKRSREHADNAEYQNFQKFSNLWNNTVKTQWAESMVQGKVMTYDQIANIDAQISQWGQLAQPKSYAMFIYLGIALLVIIILAVMLIRAKSASKS